MQKKKILILLGPPGAGKGTLSALCAKKFGWKHVATGNLCRQEMQDKTELGLQMEALILAGKLVPDEIIVQMVENWLQERQDLVEGVIFDGIPRTVHQAKFIAKMLHEKFLEFEPLIIQLQVQKDALLYRILSRLICSNKECQTVYSLHAFVDKQQDEYRCEICGSVLQQRSDDTKEALEKRLDDYYQYEKDVLHYYKEHNVQVYQIDANQPVDKVFENLEKITTS